METNRAVIGDLQRVKSSIEMLDPSALKELDDTQISSRRTQPLVYTNKLGLAGVMYEPKLFREFFGSLIQSNTPRTFWRWGMLSAVAATVGRNCWLPYSSVDNTYPNLFVILCAESTVGKSEVIKLINSLVKQSKYKYVTTTTTTKEKFLDDLAKGFGMPEDKNKDADNLLDSIDWFSEEDAKNKVHEGYILSTEMASFFNSNSRETTDWSALLRDVYDCPDTIGSKSRMGANTQVNKPVVNFLAGTVPLELKYFFGADGLMNGLFSRCITCYALPTGTSFPHPSYDKSLLDRAANTLSEIRNMSGEMSLDEDAKELLQRIAVQCNDNEGGLLRTWRARKVVHTKKVAMILALCDLRMVITSQDIYHASCILGYTEDFMEAAVIGCTTSQTFHKELQLLGELNSSRIPLDASQLHSRVGMSANNSTQFQDLFLKLHSLTYIREVHTIARKQSAYYTSQWVLKAAHKDDSNVLWEYGYLPLLEIGKRNGHSLQSESEQTNHR